MEEFSIHQWIPKHVHFNENVLQIFISFYCQTFPAAFSFSFHVMLCYSYRLCNCSSFVDMLPLFAILKNVICTNARDMRYVEVHFISSQDFINDACRKAQLSHDYNAASGWVIRERLIIINFHSINRQASILHMSMHGYRYTRSENTCSRGMESW